MTITRAPSGSSSNQAASTMPAKLSARACACLRIWRRSGRNGCARRYRGAWLNSGRIHRRGPCRNGFLPAGGASSREAGESLVGVEYRIVFHPKAEAELEQLYGDIAGRASPAIAWKFIAGIPTIVSVCRLFHSGAPSGSRSCLAADCWLPRQHCLCRRGRAGPDPGQLLRRPEHHTGIARGPALSGASVENCSAVLQVRRVRWRTSAPRARDASQEW